MSGVVGVPAATRTRLFTEQASCRPRTFFVAVLIFGIYSIFLLYHWFRYGMNVLVSVFASIIYLGVSALILIVTLISFVSLIS